MIPNPYTYNPFYNVGAQTYDSSMHQTESQPIYWGLPFEKPLAQSFLPVVTADGQNYGYVGIPTTTFQGTETTITIDGVSVAIASATLPQRIDSPRFHPERTRIQFMAIKITHQEEYGKMWIGFKNWHSNETGVFAKWSMPLADARKRYDFGALYNAVEYGWFVIGQPLPPTPMPTPQDATLRWACAVSIVALQQECPFFDFPWTQVFKASVQSDQINPKRIEVVENPPTGEFRAQLVTAPEGGQVVPSVGLMFNTIRILKVRDVVPGDFVFKFKIYDMQNNTYDVQLTLTVPDPNA